MKQEGAQARADSNIEQSFIWLDEFVHQAKQNFVPVAAMLCTLLIVLCSIIALVIACLV